MLSTDEQCDYVGERNNHFFIFFSHEALHAEMLPHLAEWMGATLNKLSLV